MLICICPPWMVIVWTRDAGLRLGQQRSRSGCCSQRSLVLMLTNVWQLLEPDGFSLSKTIKDRDHIMIRVWSKKFFYAYNHSPWQCVQQWILWCSKWMTLAIRITRMFTQHTSLQDRILIRVRRMVTLHKEQVLLALTGMLHNGWEQYLFSQSRQSCFPTQKVDQKCIP